MTIKTANNVRSTILSTCSLEVENDLTPQIYLISKALQGPQSTQ